MSEVLNRSRLTKDYGVQPLWFDIPSLEFPEHVKTFKLLGNVPRTGSRPVYYRRSWIISRVDQHLLGLHTSLNKAEYFPND